MRLGLNQDKQLPSPLFRYKKSTRDACTMSSMKKPSVIRRLREFEANFSEVLEIAEYLLLRLLLFLTFLYGVYELARQALGRQ